MARREFSREFLLVAACCRWPLSAKTLAGIRSAGTPAIDWASVLWIAKRQRVGGLVQNALTTAGIEPPNAVSQQLAAAARAIAWQNQILAVETVRLQQVFDVAGLRTVALKGVTIAQLAYGSLSLKHGKDIDVLVEPDRVHDAMTLLVESGYELPRSVRDLGAAQWNVVVEHGAEVALRRGRLEIELRWRLTDNPLLLTGINACSPTQDVPLPGGARVRTFANEDLFAYLCVHGASHAWSRLKWLADLNAFIAARSESDIEDLYRHAEARASGRCAGLALMLCHQLLGLSLPSGLRHELQDDRVQRILSAMALDAMTGRDAGTELEDRPFGSTRVSLMQFLLGKGRAYFVAQCRVASVRLGDIIENPLPSWLHVLYPVLRLPLWIWRRAISSGGNRRMQNRPDSHP